MNFNEALVSTAALILQILLLVLVQSSESIFLDPLLRTHVPLISFSNDAGGGRYLHSNFLTRTDVPSGYEEQLQLVYKKDSCTGICVQSSTCANFGGSPNPASACADRSAVCCAFEKPCTRTTKEMTSYFNSPGYPGPTVGTLICQYEVVVQPGICGIRLDFLEFNTTRPLDRGLCHVDQFLVMNSLEGAAFPRCGELTGYSTIVPVDARHRVPLTLLSIVQSSREQYRWNIKITQMKCDKTKKIANHPICGKKFEEGNVNATAAVEEPRNTIIPGLEQDGQPVPHGNGNQGKMEMNMNRASATMDNAFYVEYLKQAYQAITDPTNPNNTLCKNTAADILAEKLAQQRRLLEEEPPSLRILRGSNADLNEFPWQVSIQDDEGHTCGGSIIDEYHILTASHCFLSVSPVPLRLVRIVVGDLNINQTTEATHEFADVHSVLFHSHFDPYYLRNDIALIRLRQALKFRAGVLPVCLPETGNSYSGKKATISGWGAVSFPQGRLATHLQYVSNDVIENSECRRILKIDYLFNTMLCAVSPKCSGTCFGDSGGPLVTDQNGRSHLIGIVSFGIGGCALLPYWPDVYTRVTEYVDWLSYATTF